jgi:hypothetical protein
LLKQQQEENTITTTRTIIISEELYQRFYNHSCKYYDIESYETILSNLLDCYEEHNKDKHWFNTTTIDR